MVRSAAQGNPVEAVSGEGRQFSDVSRVAEVVRILTRTDNPHPAYICVDREIFTWEQVAQMVVTCLSSSGGVRVLPSDHPGPIPRFRTRRAESLLGKRSNSESALIDHIRYLAQSMEITSATEQ
jgi:dTDP-4-dehydrorhamnose reductase